MRIRSNTPNFRAQRVAPGAKYSFPIRWRCSSFDRPPVLKSERDYQQDIQRAKAPWTLLQWVFGVGGGLVSALLCPFFPAGPVLAIVGGLALIKIIWLEYHKSLACAHPRLRLRMMQLEQKYPSTGKEMFSIEMRLHGFGESPMKAEIARQYQLIDLQYHARSAFHGLRASHRIFFSLEEVGRIEAFLDQRMDLIGHPKPKKILAQLRKLVNLLERLQFRGSRTPTETRNFFMRQFTPLEQDTLVNGN